MWTQLSSELSAEVDWHSQLLGASYNMDMSILEKEHLGLRIRDGGARARAQHSLAEQPAMWFLRSRLGHLFRHDTL